MHFDTQFTFYGIKEAEHFLQDVLYKAKKLFEEKFDEEETAALILIGGYGRGEGGVVKINDHYRPHNNLDLIYIHNQNIEQSRIDEVNKALQVIADEEGIGIDLSAINKEKLLSLRGLVIGYDMRFGHKCLLGNSDFLRNHRAFDLYDIDPADARQLLVNRGTLLLINKALLRQETLGEKEKKLIIKHAIKAIIGYGDALLFFHNKYHWSYAQKQTNMMQLKEASPEIRALYDEAILFRFKPNYERYLQKDMQAYNDELLEALSKVHLECEKLNLEYPSLTWDNYFTMALQKKSYARQSFKQGIKSTLFAFKNLGVMAHLENGTQKRSFRHLGGKGMLSLLFPYIAYEVYPKDYSALFDTALKTKGSENYLRAFLKLWGSLADTNFTNVLRTYNIDLESL